MQEVADLLKTNHPLPLYVFYQAEFGRSTSNGLNTGTGNPKNWEHLGSAGTGRGRG